MRNSALQGAVGVARDFRPEVLLIDLARPGMNGFEIARRIRSDAALDEATLVALTSRSRSATTRCAAC